MVGGDFTSLVCTDCKVVVTVDEVDAGLPLDGPSITQFKQDRDKELG